MKTDTIKLLVVTGGPTHRHQIDLVPTSFYRLFEGYDNLVWDHATQDEAAFQSDKLLSYDVVLMYNRSDTLSQNSKLNLQSFLEADKGFIVLHHALGSYNDWEWWWRKVVGAKYQMTDIDNLPKSNYKQGEIIDLAPQKSHFITDQVGKFTLLDETYKNLWISKNIQILYRTSNPSGDGPVVWISPLKTSKVVVIQPGHAHAAHSDENYRNLIFQSILWASQ